MCTIYVCGLLQTNLLLCWTEYLSTYLPTYLPTYKQFIQRLKLSEEVSERTYSLLKLALKINSKCEQSVLVLTCFGLSINERKFMHTMFLKHFLVKWQYKSTSTSLKTRKKNSVQKISKLQTKYMTVIINSCTLVPCRAATYLFLFPLHTPLKVYFLAPWWFIGQTHKRPPAVIQSRATPD